MRPKVDGFVKSLNLSFSSFPRRREASVFKYFWMPAFAGMTRFRIFYEPVNYELRFVMILNTPFACSGKLYVNI